MKESRNGSAMLDGPGHVSLVGHMLTCLLSHLDWQSRITNLSILDIARVFQSMSTFMDSSIANHVNNIGDAMIDTFDDEDVWSRRLDFELNIDT
jgi:hypothetical protein